MLVDRMPRELTAQQVRDLGMDVVAELFNRVSQKLTEKVEELSNGEVVLDSDSESESEGESETESETESEAESEAESDHRFYSNRSSDLVSVKLE
ncbi:hypothetical protein FRC12_022280 [Ceratobasidium sp. 428]|nr:hypothetical protein FRC12_022280 [Ceratobasidium sp. 428]